MYLSELIEQANKFLKKTELNSEDDEVLLKKRYGLNIKLFRLSTGNPQEDSISDSEFQDN